MSWPPPATTPTQDERVGGSLHKKSGDTGIFRVAGFGGSACNSRASTGVAFPSPASDEGASQTIICKACVCLPQGRDKGVPYPRNQTGSSAPESLRKEEGLGDTTGLRKGAATVPRPAPAP